MARRRIWRLRPERAGTTVEIDGEMVVGRSRAARLRIDDTKISRRHARIWLDEGGAMLEDLASTNGTFLNGRRLSAPMPLVPGDRIAFDTTRFVVEAAFEDAGPRPAPDGRDVMRSDDDPRKSGPRDRAAHARTILPPPRPSRSDDERTVVAPREASFDLGATDFEGDEDGDDGGQAPES
ncbi:MAG: FHA domain-containing protein [Pseudomonadales bacterium]|jgi:predicted component of type VI protein secretion system|nr:FHA domain-containing protein [Pseudomonadales bacterium]